LQEKNLALMDIKLVSQEFSPWHVPMGAAARFEMRKRDQCARHHCYSWRPMWKLEIENGEASAVCLFIP
jgi:hypothetical protein